MKRTKSTAPIALLSLIFTLGNFACGKKKSNDDAAPAAAAPAGEVASPDRLAVQLNVVTAGSAQSNGLALAADDAYVGQTSPAELISLKYLLTNISICQTVELSGSGYTQPQKCISLYENTKYNSMYDTFGRAEAEKSDYDADYIDLMKGLSTKAEISSNDVGTYRYALVNWMKPIRVTAQVKVNDFFQTILYTHKGTYGTLTDQNGVEHFETYFKSMTEGPAEEAVVLLNNGGSVFSFSSPFVITEADIANRATYVMDMVFNPDGLVKAISGQASGAAGHSLIEVTSTTNPRDNFTGNAIDVPYISLVPLVHKTTETITKETYMANFDAGLLGTAADPATTVTALPAAGEFDARVELYYITPAGGTFSADTPIYGASTLAMLRDNTISSASNWGSVTLPLVFSLAQDATTKEYSLYGWQGDADGGRILTGLKRLETIGASGTLKTSCESYVVPYVGCYDGPTNSFHQISFTVPYSLVARETLTALSESNLSALESTRLDLAAQKALALEGSGWVSGCVADGTGKYIITTLDFTEDELFKSDTEVYSDSACATIYSKKWFVGRTTVGTTVSTNGPNKFNLSVLSITETPRSAQAVADFDANSHCGMTGWMLDTGFDTFGRTCDGVVNPVRYDMRYYSIEKSSAGLKLWGAATVAADGLTQSKRIVTLSDVVFTEN